MADVATYSTSLMSDADRQAVAAYLKTLPARADDSPAAPDPAAMKTGAEIFSDACAAATWKSGGPAARLPAHALRRRSAQQAASGGLIHLILAGGRVGVTQSRPSPLTMPSFAWKLTDQQVADVATYVRNSWGNRAQPVSALDVARMRRRSETRHQPADRQFRRSRLEPVTAAKPATSLAAVLQGLQQAQGLFAVGGHPQEPFAMLDRPAARVGNHGQPCGGEV